MMGIWRSRILRFWGFVPERETTSFSSRPTALKLAMSWGTLKVGLGMAFVAAFLDVERASRLPSSTSQNGPPLCEVRF